MPDYKIVVAYDGTDYSGWQRQSDRPSIVGILEEAFKGAFSSNVYIRGASRTDAGVHARGQVAVLKTSVDLPGRLIVDVWNRALPDSVLVRSVERRDGFNPLDRVVQKTYSYRLFRRRPDPFRARYGWFWEYLPKARENMFRRSLELFVGTHDFRSFCKLDPRNPVKTVRTVYSISVSESENELLIHVTGNGFAHFQVRRMIGSALYYSLPGREGTSKISEMLENPQAQQHTLKAPAKGLCLEEILYSDE